MHTYLLVLVETHNAAVHRDERQQSEGSIHVSGVEHVVAVGHLVEARRTGDVDLVHAGNHIHAVVLGAEQLPEHAAHLGGEGAVLEGLAGVALQVGVPPVRGLALRRVVRHGPLADRLHVALQRDVSHVALRGLMGSRLVGASVVGDLTLALLHRGVHEIALHHAVVEGGAGEEAELVLRVHAVAAQGAAHQGTQKPGKGVQALHLVGDGRFQDDLDVGGHHHVHEG